MTFLSQNLIGWPEKSKERMEDEKAPYQLASPTNGGNSNFINYRTIYDSVRMLRATLYRGVCNDKKENWFYFPLT